MFLGGTSKEILGHVLELLDRSNASKFFAPFAGNFFLEQMCRSAKRGNEIHVHSTDVSTYSNLLGFGISGKEHTIKLLPEYGYLFDFLPELTIDDYGVIAMIVSEMAIILNRAKTVPYYEGLVADYMKNRQKYWEKAKAKYESVKATINKGPFTYYGIDAGKVLKIPQAGDLVYYDPPFNTGSYEKQFKDFNAMFIGNDVEYGDITPEVVSQNLHDLHDRGCVVIYRGQSHFLNEGIITLPPEFAMVHKTMYKGEDSYLLYTNQRDAECRVYNLNKLNEKVINYPLISEDDEITAKSKVHVVKVPGEVLNHYRMLWIKKAKMTGGAEASYLIFIDSKLIGGFQIVSGVKFGVDLCMILSDPACPHSKYKRLSKLLIAVICTEPVLREINKQTVWLHHGYTTRVFTDNKMSMKYRGLFDKAGVEDAKEGNYKYGVIYRYKNLFYSPAHTPPL